MDKVAIFVDMGYLSHVTKAHGNVKIDYAKLATVLINETKETHYRTYLYNCPPYQSNPPTDEEKLRKSKYDRFIFNIKKAPRIELRTGRLVKKNETLFVQKGVDTYFAIDLVKLCFNKAIQKAILIAGDSDFVPAIKEAKEQQVIIKTYYHKGTIHTELQQSCDEVEEITPEFIQKIKLL